MSGIHRTKIEWADSVWNPVSGCLHGCDYCFAKRQVKRFQPKPSEWPEPNTVIEAKHDPRCFIEIRPTVLRDADGAYIRSTPYPKGFSPTMHSYKLTYPNKAIRPRRIFVGSMCDLFGEWIPDEWLKAIFDECAKAPQHVYMFLTKNPKRYEQLESKNLLPMWKNYFYGSTITTPDKLMFTSNFINTFLSIEPILSDFTPCSFDVIKWIIVGAMTGPKASKNKPKREWIENIIEYCRDTKTPTFMKSSLTDVLGKSLIQEYPDTMMAHIAQKLPPTDWKNSTHDKVFVNSVRDAKECRQCKANIQGKSAWRISARYYICQSCYNGEN